MVERSNHVPSKHCLVGLVSQTLVVRYRILGERNIIKFPECKIEIHRFSGTNKRGFQVLLKRTNEKIICHKQGFDSCKP